MPGLFGFVEPNPTIDPASLLDSMAESMDPTSRFERAIHHENGFAFGRVGRSLSNWLDQPIWNKSKSSVMVIEGEIYSVDPSSTLPGSRGDENGAKAMHHSLFEIHQPTEINRLAGFNGAFAAAVWEPKTRTLTLINDRLGLQPIYYARVGQGLVFGSGVRALLADARLNREIDRVAIAEFLTFDHVLRQRTFLKSVSLLPQGSILTFRDGQLTIRSYWEPTPPTFQTKVDPERAYSQIVALLKEAIQRQSPAGEPAGLLLSGGLDSRILLAAIAESSFGGNFRTFTWGIPGCDDARFAKEAARAVRASHSFFELKPDWLKYEAERGIRLTDGMANVVNLHALAALDPIASQTEILFKGFLGDAMFGFGLPRRYWAQYSNQDYLQVHLQAYREYDVLTFDLPLHDQLFTDDFKAKVGQDLLADYQKTIDESNSNDLGLQRLYIDYTQRVQRMTINGVLVARDKTTVRLPFADNQLVDFALSLPPGLLFNRHVMKEGFRRAYPQMAQIPVTPEGLPMMDCARDILLRTRKLLQWHLSRRGLGALAGPSVRPYKDYNLWFRTVLKDWVESILLQSPFLDRGYFQPEFVQKVIQDHMAGADNAVRLGAFISLELWHQMYLDGVVLQADQRLVPEAQQ